MFKKDKNSYNVDLQIKNLKENINKFIVSSGYKPSQIADLLEVDRSAISLWMNGKRIPTAKNLIELANILNISVVDFWKNTDVAILQTKKQQLLKILDRLNSQQTTVLLEVAKNMIPTQEVEEIIKLVTKLNPEQQRALIALAEATAK